MGIVVASYFFCGANRRLTGIVINAIGTANLMAQTYMAFSCFHYGPEICANIQKLYGVELLVASKRPCSTASDSRELTLWVLFLCFFLKNKGKTAFI